MIINNNNSIIIIDENTSADDDDDDEYYIFSLSPAVSHISCFCRNKKQEIRTGQERELGLIEALLAGNIAFSFILLCVVCACIDNFFCLDWDAVLFGYFRWLSPILLIMFVFVVVVFVAVYLRMCARISAETM